MYGKYCYLEQTFALINFLLSTRQESDTNVAMLLEIAKKKEILPNGKRINLEIIKHPGAILIIPLLERDKIVLR